jgi:hypothetical protein
MLFAPADRVLITKGAVVPLMVALPMVVNPVPEPAVPLLKVTVPLAPLGKFAVRVTELP